MRDASNGKHMERTSRGRSGAGEVRDELQRLGRQLIEFFRRKREAVFLAYAESPGDNLGIHVPHDFTRREGANLIRGENAEARGDGERE